MLEYKRVVHNSWLLSVTFTFNFKKETNSTLIKLWKTNLVMQSRQTFKTSAGRSTSVKKCLVSGLPASQTCPFLCSLTDITGITVSPCCEENLAHISTVWGGERKVFQGVSEVADREVGREPTARVVGYVAGQLKSHTWGRKSWEKSGSPCWEGYEVMDFRQLGWKGSAKMAIEKEEVRGGADDAL